ncbi:MAG: hypothetical protein AB7I50_15685 [Vicinamibacterales bacterium]
MTVILQEITDRVASGAALDGRDFEALWSTDDLVRLGMLADDARRRRFGATVTYVRVADFGVNDLGGADVPSNAGECRVVAPAAELIAHLDAIAAFVARAGAVPVTAGHLEEFVALGSQSTPALRSLAGTGVTGLACAAVDRLPHAEQAVAAALDSGLSIARFVVEHPTQTSPWPLLERVRLVQRSTGAVRAFAPLPRHVDDNLPTTGYADVKAVALARLALPDVERIQVDWARYGAKLSQVALVFGANDIDTTIDDDGAATGWRRAAGQEIVRNIQAASLTPVERDGRFVNRTTAPTARMGE